LSRAPDSNPKSISRERPAPMNKSGIACAMCCMNADRYWAVLSIENKMLLRYFPKLDVAGSILVARSKPFPRYRCASQFSVDK
jgi:hypothetical protein